MILKLKFKYLLNPVLCFNGKQYPTKKGNTNHESGIIEDSISSNIKRVIFIYFNVFLNSKGLEPLFLLKNFPKAD